MVWGSWNKEDSEGSQHAKPQRSSHPGGVNTSRGFGHRLGRDIGALTPRQAHAKGDYG
jgi:hypothetical protein